MLIYIENKELLSKIVTYLDYVKKNYTLDINDDYEYILISDLNKKSMELSIGKKIIFISYLIEERLHSTYLKNNKRNREYRNKVINNFNNFYKIIVSIESIKNILQDKIKTNIVVINKELPIINISNSKHIYDRFKIKKRRKNILFIDFNYEKLDYIYAISSKYEKFNFIYLGFNPEYNLTKKSKVILKKLPNNVYKIKNYDLNLFSDLIKITDIVINTSDIIINIDYLYIIFFFKKNLISMNDVFYDDYLINSKHLYLFQNFKELIIRFDRILDNRVSNISDNGYDLIINNYFTQIADKYSIYLP